jgi:hypothetical protein
MTEEALQSLRAFRARLYDQLIKVPEYRALTVIDRTIQEISEIYGAPANEPERGATAPIKQTAASAQVARLVEAKPIAETAQSRIAMAIAEAIESNVSQLRTQRLPQAAAYTLVGAAS